MLLSESVSDFLAVKNVTLSPGPRQQYSWVLDAFLEYCHQKDVEETERLSASIVAGYVTSLQTPRHNSKTVVTYYKIVHAFLRWAVDEELVHRRILHLDAPKSEKKIPSVFEDGQVLKLVRAASSSRGNAMKARNAAIVLLLADTGIRASECVGLTVDRVNTENGGYIIVKGKGNKWRECGPLSQRTIRALRAWMTKWRPRCKPKSDILFLSHTGEGIGRIALHQLLVRLKTKAGIDAPAGPHKFRHSWARSQALAGADVLAISRLMGHTSISTTQLYLNQFGSRDARNMVSSVVDGL